MRGNNSNRAGGAFPPAVVEAVWRKGQVVPGYDPAAVRKDRCGAWIQRPHYGRTDSHYGWEVDHIIPVALNGTDDLANLQPLQWQNNRHKGDNFPNWTCAVRAA